VIDQPEQLVDLRNHITPPPTLVEHVGQLIDLYQTLIKPL